MPPRATLALVAVMSLRLLVGAHAVWEFTPEHPEWPANTSAPAMSGGGGARHAQATCPGCADTRCQKPGYCGTSHDNHNCNSCLAGYYPRYCGTGGSHCFAFKGNCTNGDLAEQSARRQHNHCGSCNDGYRLDGPKCVADANEWVQLYAAGVYDNGGSQQTKVEFDTGYKNAVGANVGIIRRECADCAVGWRDIFYARRTIPRDFRPWQYMMVTWSSRGNELNKDFSIHSSLDDALQDKNRWVFCNYNDTNIGFPRDCGPAGYKAYQWTSLTDPRSRKSFKYSVLKDRSSAPATSTTSATVVDAPGSCAVDLAAQQQQQLEAVQTVASAVRGMLAAAIDDLAAASLETTELELASTQLGEAIEARCEPE